jgi:hypothetical protein
MGMQMLFLGHAEQGSLSPGAPCAVEVDEWTRISKLNVNATIGTALIQAKRFSQI